MVRELSNFIQILTGEGIDASVPDSSSSKDKQSHKYAKTLEITIILFIHLIKCVVPK